MDEAHPIPQNVTSFEFHLVGDMTLKQFGYLAAGLVSAYLTFIIFFPIAPLIAAPFILLFALLGAAYAFLPILDRPLDHWTKAFFKAIYSPTRGKWKSPFDSNLSINPDDPIFKDRLKSYLAVLSAKQSQITPPAQEETVSTPDQLTEQLSKKTVLEVRTAAEPEKLSHSPTSPIRLAKEGKTQPHPVHPIPKPILSQPVPALKPLKINPINISQSQTVQSIRQEIDQSRIKPALNQISEHQPFTAAFKLSPFADSELDFSPQHNPALQHLQFMYNHPTAQSEKPTLTNQTVWPVVPSLSPKPQPTNLQIRPVMPPPPLPPIQPSISNFPIRPAVSGSKSPTLPSVPTPENKDKLPTNEELNKLVEIAKEAQLLQNKIEEAEKHIKEITVSAVSTPDYKDKFSQVYSNLQDLINKTDTLGKQATEAHKVIPPPVTKSVSVKITEPPKPQTSQPILTSQPNVINGIATDFNGNFIEGVIIIIHDKDGLPVRALKTNKIGQFTGTTPLPAGVYTVTLEKEGLEFDTLEVNLNGDVLPPLQISAKGGSSLAHA